MSNADTAPNRWLMLAVSMSGQVTGTLLVNAGTFLIPYLHLRRGLSLTHAGLIAAAPTVGLMLTLIAWGAFADRRGERVAMGAGLAIVTLGALAASFTTSYVALSFFLFLCGAGAASVNSASGRVVIGWFPPERRGTAMGIRQMAQPLGVGLAAVLLPNLVDAHGLRPALLVPTALVALSLLLTVTLVVDPPRPTRQQAEALGHLANPYRRDDRLWRIHAASMLLVVPQFTVWTFMTVWLITERHWSTGAATILVAATQLLGAGGRVGAGAWSDRVGSRLRPLRQVAVAAFVTMLALGLLERTWLSIVVIVVATVVTVADNGLAYTSVAEIGGPFWSGRALGAQNTGQFLASSLVPPLVGALISGHGYAWAFGLVALFPLVAIPLVPRDRHPDRAV